MEINSCSRKKAIIVDTFNNYEMRCCYVKDALEQLDYSVKIFASNFLHTSKSFIGKQEVKSIEFLPTLPYKKNLSFARIKSHLNFAKKVYKRLLKENPDVVYCILPPNFLAKYIRKYKRKNKNVVVYFDIFDLWPESLPANSTIKKLLFPWRALRNCNIDCAEKIITECDYYHQFLPVKDEKTVTIYLSKEKRACDFVENCDELNLLYLGSVNNIIDIDGIVQLCLGISEFRKVVLHIIGGGEKYDEFIEKVKCLGVSVVEYGKIFDEKAKDEIISKCQFGINFYKPQLCIGLTMKSIDYFNRGLPVLTNNIFDTAYIVNRYHCGIAFEEGDALEKLKKLTYKSWCEMRDASVKAYDELFAPSVVFKQFERLFKERDIH